MINYYIVDCETTGLNSQYHELNEVSIIRCSDRMQLTIFVRCDYPERANFDSLMITGKTLADLDNGDTKNIAINKINSFLNEDGLNSSARCFIAHNWSFDKKFIHALYEKENQNCPVDLWLCTMALSKQYVKQSGLIKQKVNLHAACDMLGVKKYAAAHNSKVDTRNTFLLWKKLIEEHKIDYIPHIKSAPHIIAKSDEEELLDLLDI